MPASIFVGTPTAATVAAGGTLPITSIFRRQCGCITQQGADSVILSRPGYYRITATVTFTAPATGVATLTLTQDGQAVPGITASNTIATATTEVSTIAVSGIVRVACCSGSSALQLLNAGVAINSSNVSLDVEYLG